MTAVALRPLVKAILCEVLCRPIQKIITLLFPIMRLSATYP